MTLKCAFVWLGGFSGQVQENTLYFSQWNQSPKLGSCRMHWKVMTQPAFSQQAYNMFRFTNNVCRFVDRERERGWKQTDLNLETFCKLVCILFTCKAPQSLRYSSMIQAMKLVRLSLRKLNFWETCLSARINFNHICKTKSETEATLKEEQPAHKIPLVLNSLKVSAMTTFWHPVSGHTAVAGAFITKFLGSPQDDIVALHKTVWFFQYT